MYYVSNDQITTIFYFGVCQMMKQKIEEKLFLEKEWQVSISTV